MQEDLNIDFIFKMEDSFRTKFGFNFLKPEAKMILMLKMKNSLSIKESMSFLDLSYRGFYILLKRMEQSGTISLSDDPSDRRVKRIALRRDKRAKTKPVAPRAKK